ncbi:conserved unknown protein [Ectocarpus siliculosus]|uniref:MRPL25 domain-containing protein n=1 Tax=Ectocarpus siliculosus TaxID=2880 RepID=D7G4S4_ECTSI|nr:conserved unknown protein [Ectocarpus siliculosus]|eukprot:CBJ27167.1 conserved unknown protein [Ectocarpus siliculosus]
MRTVSTFAVAALAGTSSVVAFAPPSAPLRPVTTRSSSSAALKMVYIPDGLSPAEWKKIKDADKKKQENLGKLGPSRFKSRSFQAWQESGAGHLFPVDPKKVKSGEIPMDKVPYMQRGGAWDNSDLTSKKGQAAMRARKDKVVLNNKVSKGVKQKAWSSTDKAYAAGGYKKEQSVSIFGGTPLPWVSGAAQKSPGVEVDNKRRINEQKKVKRAATNAPMSAAVKRRVEKEAAEERRKQEKLKKQLNGEKKGLFGMW